MKHHHHDESAPCNVTATTKFHCGVVQPYFSYTVSKPADPSLNLFLVEWNRGQLKLVIVTVLHILLHSSLPKHLRQNQRTVGYRAAHYSLRLFVGRIPPRTTPAAVEPKCSRKHGAIGRLFAIASQMRSKCRFWPAATVSTNSFRR